MTTAPYSQNLEELKNKLFSDVCLRLGGGIVDLEVDPEHLEMAFSYAMRTYRQRAQNSTQETYTLLTTEKGVDTYTLPAEFVNVRALYRRGVGLETGQGTSFDPFSSAVLNTYLLNYNHSGGLATYDFYAGYVKLSARMFGGYITYTFDPVTKVLRVVRNFKGTGEQILIWADIQRPDAVLIQDPYAGVWLFDYTLATVKTIIGEAREKFSSVPGPGGGTTLNGAAMKAEGLAMQEKLLDGLRKYVDGSMPLTWIQG